MENLLLKQVLMAIEDKINQYHEGNLTVEMAIKSITEIIEAIQGQAK